MTALLAWAFAVAAGALVTVQAGANAELKRGFGEPVPALIVNYLLGLSVVVAYFLAMRISWPSFEKMGAVPWWAWFGGLAGSAYGVAAILLAGRLGAATLMALVLTGQLVASVILDHFGWVGFEVHPASIGRIAGCLLMLAGLACISMF